MPGNQHRPEDGLFTENLQVYSFGSNRFGQLGYLPPGGREKANEKIQLSKYDGLSNLFEPTRIVPLRVHHVPRGRSCDI